MPSVAHCVTRVKEKYRGRIAIATSYRQMHQGRIRTYVRDPLLRLLFVGIALILRNVGCVCTGKCWRVIGVAVGDWTWAV